MQLNGRAMVNDNMVIYIENKLLDNIKNETSTTWFQSMKSCHGQL